MQYVAIAAIIVIFLVGYPFLAGGQPTIESFILGLFLGALIVAFAFFQYMPGLETSGTV